MASARDRSVLWGILGVLAVGAVAAVLAIALGGGDDEPSLAPDRNGLTRTEIDIDDPLSDGNSVRATVIADDDDRCVWLVNVAGADPGTRLIMAWPEGSQLEWDPFALRLDDTDATITQGTAITASGYLVASDEDLDDDAFDRLLGLFRCSYDGVFVADGDDIAVGATG